jgi:hypothetical protein
MVIRYFERDTMLVFIRSFPGPNASIRKSRSEQLLAALYLIVTNQDEFGRRISLFSVSTIPAAIEFTASHKINYS